MLIEYMQKAIEIAEYKKLDDNTWFAEIAGFDGVWANGASVEECRKELMEVLEEWLFLKIQDKDPIHVLKGISLKIKELAVA
jgi:predicted RNase H-like HicB family nuclease